MSLAAGFIIEQVQNQKIPAVKKSTSWLLLESLICWHLILNVFVLVLMFFTCEPPMLLHEYKRRKAQNVIVV